MLCLGSRAPTLEVGKGEEQSRAAVLSEEEQWTWSGRTSLIV